MRQGRRLAAWLIGLGLVALALPGNGSAAVAPTVSLTVTPASGPPGTWVTLSGRVTPAPRTPNPYSAVVDFGGYPDGLVIEPGHVTWSPTTPGAFRLRIRVPAAPWLSPRGERPLTPGPYPIAVQCLGVITTGCATAPPEGEATFRLTGPGVPYRTPTLTVSPAAAAPGQTVVVQGWAPLTEEFGGQVLAGYQLALVEQGRINAYGDLGLLTQAPDGTVTGTVQIPAALPPFGALGPTPAHLAMAYTFTTGSSSTLLLGSTPFTVEAPPSWAAVTRGQQVTSLASTENDGYFAGVSAAGGAFYATSAGGLWRSRDGRHWHPVPTGPLMGEVERLGYRSFGGITGVTTGPGHPESLYVVLSTASSRYGAPPVQFFGGYTTDGGRSWALVPPPTGTAPEDFSGFTVVGHAVWAWFVAAGRLVAEGTADGGHTWHVMPARCPTAGPCLLIGPVPSEDYGQMGGTSPNDIVTAVHGHWHIVLTGSNFIGPTELALTASGGALAVNTPGYSALWSRDGGHSWVDLALPPLPGAASGTEPVVHLLPNGVMLALDPANSGWYVLAPGSRRWVVVPPQDRLPGYPVVTTVGSLVVWETIPLLNNQGTIPPVRFLALPAAIYETLAVHYGNRPLRYQSGRSRELLTTVGTGPA